MTEFAILAERAAEELKDAAGRVHSGQLEELIDAIIRARRIVVAGVGREGLMMRALAMRLFHMGLDAHVTGDMTTPPIGAGDLLIASAGPGDFSTIQALVKTANADGADTFCITAEPEGAVPCLCNQMLFIPAQTMASDSADMASSTLPMGSLFEGAQYLVFECAVLLLRERLGINPEAMRANHTNLE